MSERIEQIVEVIEEVRENFQIENVKVNQIRVMAVDSIAKRRSITKQSVLDKFIRQLQPDIKSAKDFDRLLKDWLVDGNDELKNIILKYRIDSQDIDLINNAFHIGTGDEILLAQHFGLNPNEKIFKEGKLRL